jgi:hypothetical protein|tara:strand:- start:161 stop:445 length:285 start_codon:yes stop_codon:yes gene_type:complete
MDEEAEEEEEEDEAEAAAEEQVEEEFVPAKERRRFCSFILRLLSTFFCAACEANTSCASVDSVISDPRFRPPVDKRKDFGSVRERGVVLTFLLV